MTVSWDQLPLEMRKAVVKELDVRSRVNLSMCSISENQLVRGAKYGKVEAITLEGNGLSILYKSEKENHNVLVGIGYHGGSTIIKSKRLVNAHREVHKEYRTATTWRQTIWNVMSLIGTRITTDSFELMVNSGFEDQFNWFRSNFHVKTSNVRIKILYRDDYNEECLMNWSPNTKIELIVLNSRIPEIENTFNNIVTFNFFDLGGFYDDLMTDELLKQLKNVKEVDLAYSDVTINGFDWWMKKWLNQKDDNNEVYQFRITFKDRSAFTLVNITNKLLEVIVKTYKCSNYHPRQDYWRIEIKKNEKVGGVIKLFNNVMIFKSENLDQIRN